MTDPATGWFKIAEVPNATADFTANVLETTWLSDVHGPQKCAWTREENLLEKFQRLSKNNAGLAER